MAEDTVRSRLETSIRRAGGLTVLCRTADTRAALMSLLVNEVSAMAPLEMSIDRIEAVINRYPTARQAAEFIHELIYGSEPSGA